MGAVATDDVALLNLPTPAKCHTSVATCSKKIDLLKRNQKGASRTFTVLFGRGGYLYRWLKVSQVHVKGFIA